MRVATPSTQTANEVELVTRLRLAVGRLNRQFRQASAGGLSPSQLSALASVDKLGRVRLADLAAYEGVAPPTLTRIAAGLVELGLLERHSNPDDGRSALVSCSAEGRRAMRQVRAERTAILVRRIDGLPAAERARLADAVAFLDALVDEDRRPA